MALPLTPEEADRVNIIRASNNTRQLNHHLRLKKIHSIHSEHPEYTQKDLMDATGISQTTVQRYWKKFVAGKINVIRPWDEVMA
ncbi:winged helix-turn-helix domain-containing protein [Methanococcoides sp. AM1]|uniref:winged helix-turn-helix domain-containing protein n=1 Tax=Methanococcoides sp. AM1 TaxID=1201011 RepID=UPI001082FF9B|nr:winged helix-turn-helix domain-containing protein [Methanococcoides sp. AM1]